MSCNPRSRMLCNSLCLWSIIFGHRKHLKRAHNELRQELEEDPDEQEGRAEARTEDARALAMWLEEMSRPTWSKNWVTFYVARIQPHSFGAEATGRRASCMKCCSNPGHFNLLPASRHPAWSIYYRVASIRSIIQTPDALGLTDQPRAQKPTTCKIMLIQFYLSKVKFTLEIPLSPNILWPEESNELK